MEGVNRLPKFDRIAIIARWQPVHLGHFPVLHGLCHHANDVLVGIGSANRLDYRNPFTLEERIEMLRIVLEGRENYSLIPVNDLDDGPRWGELVRKIFGELDCFVTANPYVETLLEKIYKVIHPIEFVPVDQRIPVDGARVRLAMARGGDWQSMIPEEVLEFIQAKHLDNRFREQFGLETLAIQSMIRR
jgi:nicotinamide-nucleotide adenylyltransferase